MSRAARPSTYQKRIEAVLDQYRDKDVRTTPDLPLFRRLYLNHLGTVRWRLILATVLTVVLNMQPFVWATMARIVVDHILCVGQPFDPGVVPSGWPWVARPWDIPQHFQWVIILFVCNCGVHFLAIFLQWQSSYQVTRVGQWLTYELRRLLHERLQSLPLSFFDQAQTGRLLSIVIDDVQTIQTSISNIWINFCTNTVLVLIGLIWIACIDWRICLLVMLTMPFYVLNFRHFRPRIREGHITVRRATTALYNKVEERVTAIRTVKVFGRERGEVRFFAEAANNLARLNMYIIRLATSQNILANVLVPIVTGLTMFYGLGLVREGVITLGAALQMTTIVTFIFPPAVAVNDIMTLDSPRVSAILRRVFDLMDAEPEPEDRPGAVTLTDAQGEIIFDGVTFTYPGDEQRTLREVSIRIPAGKQVAVMGPSGAGKSTLLYLLMRFYDPERGAIKLDGRDLRDIKLLSVRDRITLVMQEPVIFSGTIAENIRYGRLDASDAEVRRAAEHADLAEFVMLLPDSYETVVGERGMSLSGGQRQRLALAASLLSNPSVLLLDDTTSALDAATEARVRETLNRVMKGRTCFVVTHRVSTAMASDLVLVLEDGQVSQFGTPADLLVQDGLFRRVYEQQQRESADEAVA